jgi:hypothetical protein
MDEIPLDTSSAPFFPILLSLKIRIEKIINQINIILKNNSKFKDKIKIFIRKLNKLFSFGVDN